jgi:hypothetical protein
MALLGVVGVGERPILHVVSGLGKKWLGRDVWKSGTPKTTTLELRRSILGDPRTLERVVAHEMVHHLNFVSMTPDDIEAARLGIKPPSHGQDFLHGAALVNSVMGDGFVTVTSDQEYVQSPHDKELYVLIAPAFAGRLGWAWAARLSPEAEAIVAEKTREGGRLVRTTDLQWASGRAKIKKFGGLNLPKAGSPKEAALRALYEGAS